MLRWHHPIRHRNTSRLTRQPHLPELDGAFLVLAVLGVQDCGEQRVSLFREEPSDVHRLALGIVLAHELRRRDLVAPAARVRAMAHALPLMAATRTGCIGAALHLTWHSK
eukprot:3355409-Prymnesium_polylepis.2